MDLFHGDKPIELKEWISVDKELPNRRGIFKVKQQKGNEITAYYLDDKGWPLVREHGSYWWDKETKEPLGNVTHWGKCD